MTIVLYLIRVVHPVEGLKAFHRVRVRAGSGEITRFGRVLRKKWPGCKVRANTPEDLGRWLFKEESNVG